jgi:antitoxin PrlF
MATTVTVKGQVTLPKSVRDASGIAPGDSVNVRTNALGQVIIEKQGAMSDYKKQLYALAKRRLIRGITTDELMDMTRGKKDPITGVRE